MASYGHGLSPLTGWLPLTLQVVPVLVLLAVVLRRAPRRWYLLWLPAPGARWWRRSLTILAVPLTLLCIGSALNRWVGYFPTVQEAWAVATAGPMPDQVTDAATSPTARSTNAMSVIDSYAAAHGGSAPTVVFVDSGGTFNNDTECVDGPRGNAADHLTEDVRSYVISRFGASAAPASWAVVGWSMGGTCAADLAVTHPELFGTFEDIAGDLGPTVGDQAQTIAQLYGGNAALWARFDPLTVLAGHAPYPDTAGWFANATGGPGAGGGHGNGRPPAAHRPATGTGFGGQADGRDSGNQNQEATQLCTATTTDRIACTLHTVPGGHTWQVAAASFADAFPWVVSRVDGPQTSLS